MCKMSLHNKWNVNIHLEKCLYTFSIGFSFKVEEIVNAEIKLPFTVWYWIKFESGFVYKMNNTGPRTERSSSSFLLLLQAWINWLAYCHRASTLYKLMAQYNGLDVPSDCITAFVVSRTCRAHRLLADIISNQLSKYAPNIRLIDTFNSSLQNML